MADFGFSIKKTRSIHLSEANLLKFRQTVEAVPSYKNCIGCGGCTATCSARQYTDFNIRKVHFSIRRGLYDDAATELQKCMLCGKCTLVCPRGVNLRSLIINIRQIISNANEPFEDGKF
ncbi:MAG: 4Fe-4S dicluster domain-containing protein [Bacteroidales bacterium]|nr:4Fe-4S dicluster domain-containing protein [Bacteroidales bacterium]